MSVDVTSIGKLVTVGDRLLGEIGEVISYTDHPTVGVRLPDGSVLDTVAYLCELATHDEAERYWEARVGYWRARAENAERQLSQALDRLPSDER